MTVTRLWLSGFLLVGVLLGLLGSLTVAWQYQIDVEPQLIGLHFLALNAGYVAAAAGAQHLLRRISLKKLALLASGLACLSLVGLFVVAPPVAVAWRLLALFAAGFSAGALGTSLLYACEPLFESSAAAAVTQAGVLFGCGCLLSTLAAGTSYFLGQAQIAPALLAVAPLAFLIMVASSRDSQAGKAARTPDPELMHEKLGDLRRIATVLFGLLLFFQFGNEWAVAGWLPLFLVHRLGTNPVLAIGVLAIYFLALMLGRVGAQKLLPRVGHRKFLIGGTAVAVCGFMLLSLAWSLAEAVTGVIVIGAGFAPIFPLIAERLDQRFPYRPGFYNGSISIAITGAMSAPWLLGFVDASLGMRYVMLLPVFGSLIVLLLWLLMSFEAHLMTEQPGKQARSARAGAPGRL